MATFYNQATLSYNGIFRTSNVVVGEVIGSLTVTKTAVGDTYSAGGNVTYVISIINTGTTPFTGLSLTDDLGAYQVGDTTVYPLEYVENSVLYYIDGVIQPTPTVTATNGIEITGISVPAGANATIIYNTAVTGFAPLSEGATIVNSVTVTGDGTTPITATETVTVEGGAVLSISKAISPATVSENDRITYTFVISNTGNAEATAADNVIVTDTFDPILSDITVTLNGVTVTQPDTYTYDETTGEFATVAGAITVPAATYTQDQTTGLWTTVPGTATLTVSGTI
ncbi:MAG: hypothetical protein IJR55_06025 [Clostridia bacterium]|nr:hypothetical protein [Clostridia bacterium]